MRDVAEGVWHIANCHCAAIVSRHPTPTQQVPIYVGGLSEPAFRRAARNDGWVSDMQTTEEFREIRAKLDAERAKIGRADTNFAMVGSCIDAFDYDGYRRLEEVGVTHLLTMPWVFYAGMTDDLQEKIDGIHRFADDIIAKFT